MSRLLRVLLDVTAIEGTDKQVPCRACGGLVGVVGLPGLRCVLAYHVMCEPAWLRRIYASAWGTSEAHV